MGKEYANKSCESCGIDFTPNIHNQRFCTRECRPLCKIEKCLEKAFCDGYCSKHHMRIRRHGNPTINLAVKHGLTTSTEYHTWISMRSRCYRTNDPAYHHYGGRGIIVCDSWLGKNGFANFLSDVGWRPDWADGGLDRIDGQGNY